MAPYGLDLPNLEKPQESAVDFSPQRGNTHAGALQFERVPHRLPSVPSGVLGSTEHSFTGDLLMEYPVDNWKVFQSTYELSNGLNHPLIEQYLKQYVDVK